jgi:hypothetical protein
MVDACRHIRDLGVAPAATVFAHSGSYDTASAFTTGFIRAVWACAALAGLGVIAALLAGPHKAHAHARDHVPTGPLDPVLER